MANEHTLEVDVSQIKKTYKTENHRKRPDTRLVFLLKHYLGTSGKSMTLMSRELGMTHQSVRNLLEGRRNALAPLDMSKILVWLCEPVDNAPKIVDSRSHIKTAATPGPEPEEEAADGTST